jgi:hypothetical protein
VRACLRRRGRRRLWEGKEDVGVDKKESEMYQRVPGPNGGAHAPFGYLSKFHSSTLAAFLTSTPSNVKAESTRWKISRLISQIGRRTPSFSVYAFRISLVLNFTPKTRNGRSSTTKTPDTGVKRKRITETDLYQRHYSHLPIPQPALTAPTPEPYRLYIQTIRRTLVFFQASSSALGETSQGRGIPQSGSGSLWTGRGDRNAREVGSWERKGRVAVGWRKRCH